jgi:hypothetical protein
MPKSLNSNFSTRLVVHVLYPVILQHDGYLGRFVMNVLNNVIIITIIKGVLPRYISLSVLCPNSYSVDSYSYYMPYSSVFMRLQATPQYTR